MLGIVKGLLPRQLKQAVRRGGRHLCETPAYLLTRGRPIEGKVHHVVFVCKGNICRSAFAEYYLRSIVPEAALCIESCGLDVDQGNNSPPDAIKIGREFGVDLSEHQARGYTACDLQNAELIVPMEYGQYRRILAYNPQFRSKTRLLRDFAPWPDRILCNFFDPYGQGESEFRRSFRGIQKALDGLKDHLSIDGK